MTGQLPSGPPAPTMRNLDRVMHLAYAHGYRVGLQVGATSDRFVLYVRDLYREEKTIAILGSDIEKTSTALFGEMLRRHYVPRDKDQAGVS